MAIGIELDASSVSLQEERVTTIRQAMPGFVKNIKQVGREYVYFNMFFLCLLVLEFLWFILFFDSQRGSYYVAISIASIFLTFFSYFILKLYFLAKKPTQFFLVREEYIKCAKRLFPIKKVLLSMLFC